MKHGHEELPHAQGEGWRPRMPSCDGTGAAERSGAEAKGSYPTSKERQLGRCKRAERRYSTFKVRSDNSSKVRSSGCALLEQL